LREPNGLKAKEDIIRVIEEETGSGLDEIKRSKGIERNILMDLLYREGGLNNAEIVVLSGSGLHISQKQVIHYSF